MTETPRPAPPWDTPEAREAGWKQWAMGQAVILRAANVIADSQLEAVAERIYRWTAFPAKRTE